MSKGSKSTKSSSACPKGMSLSKMLMGRLSISSYKLEWRLSGSHDVSIDNSLARSLMMSLTTLNLSAAILAPKGNLNNK